MRFICIAKPRRFPLGPTISWINQALAKISKKYGQKKNVAIHQTPTTIERAQEKRTAPVTSAAYERKLDTVKENQKNIVADMEILQEAMFHGQKNNVYLERLLGVQQLGRNDYLQPILEENSDEESYSEVEYRYSRQRGDRKTYYRYIDD